VTHLFLENNDTEMALFHAYSAYMDASDEVRSELLNRIQKYESKEVLDKIRKRDEAWKRDFPFLTLVFFEFLGERQSAKVPLSWDRLGEVYPKSTLPQPGDVGEGEKDVEG
jgi:ADP-dependent phosphofructokinase/glucokinase